MELGGRRSLVRTVRPADAASLAIQANNPNVARQLRDRFPHPYTMRDARRFIESISGQHPPTTFVLEVEGDAAGAIGFSPGADIERYSAEIGYWLGEPFWHRGIVTEALQIVSEYAFRECEVLRLFALPFANNLGSRRVLEKAGYTLEAILRSSAVKFAEVRDQALYARVNAAWTVRV
ncbi:MAG TPA: GNAT family N-acetyltransferase [Vicinamibacterales bacterium]|nr:GNAT family N-acetyltransferase [Vicinamibacterales bacterium]